MPKLIQIYVESDKAEISKQELKRPDSISPSEWLRFWELVRKKAWGAY